jgi:arabinose-5-phosphate isomerase
MKNLRLQIIAKSVIKQEAEALMALADTLDDAFSECVTEITGRKSRLALTGIGKSSHIARKAASTFASTGTSAFFIHPTEASHGDLGMIQGKDVLLALSRSGESSELGDIVKYCKNNNILVISITAFPNSSLAKSSDIILKIPNVREACILGLAPTTSSVMMLAICDALAMACLEVNGFAKDDFKTLHPAGNLGSSLQRVSEIMHVGEIPLLSRNASLSEAILEMTRCRFGCVGITDDCGLLIGIFTDGDLRRSIDVIHLTQTIYPLITRNPVLLDPDEFIIDAAQKFNDRRIPSAFVCTRGKPVGILHIHDLLAKGFL